MYALVVACLLSQAPNQAEPYDLKGDRLGMSLADYKLKHHRIVKGGASEELPNCSSKRPGEANDVLLTQSWHHAAGIVNCSTTFVWQNRRGEGATIADVKAEIIVHHFIDEKLYRITAILPHDGFKTVAEGLIAKFGQPKASTTEPFSNAFGAKWNGAIVVWRNGVTSIRANEYVRDRDTSMVVFSHDKLDALADSRAPKPTAKDL